LYYIIPFQSFHPFFVGFQPSTFHIAAALKNFLVRNEWRKLAVITDETVNSQTFVANLKRLAGRTSDPSLPQSFTSDEAFDAVWSNDDPSEVIDVFSLAFYSETKSEKVYEDLSEVEVFGGKVIFVYCSSETMDKVQVEAEKLRFFSKGWVWIFYESGSSVIDYNKLPVGSLVMRANALPCKYTYNF
jgi:hypothetical protein